MPNCRKEEQYFSFIFFLQAIRAFGGIAEDKLDELGDLL
jgi:hypothetical protein